MSNSTDLEAVVISSDSAIVEPVSQSLIRAEIRPAIFREIRAATECLFRKKVDAIVIDLHVDQAIPLLKELPNTPSNSRIPAFAVASNSFREAFGLAHFTFEAPIHQPSFVRALRKAYPVMLRERYHYRRHAVELPVTITKDSGNTCRGVSVNISEGGMALRCDVRFKKGDKLQIEFDLPQKPGAIKCRGEVVWSDAKQLIGLKFLSLKAPLQKLLSFWLADQW
jgi:PilZ domain